MVSRLRSRVGSEHLPWLLVLGAIVFNLVVLGAEVSPAVPPNDNNLHLAMVRWARGQIDAGHIPLDGWYPYLSLGLAQFRHYQVMPHIVAAYVSLVFGIETTFFWCLYLMLATWPISVYLCARWLGFDRWSAAAAAVVSPLIVSQTGYGYEHSSYTWRGLGVWSQLWGMWFLPLALGLGHRAVRGAGRILPASLAMAATICSHFLTGYLGLLAVGVWVLVRPREWRRRIPRAAALGAAALAASAWLLYPLVTGARYSGNLEFYRGTFWFDSYGAPKVLAWLATGQLFDSGRLPVVTVLAAGGLGLALYRARRDETARAVLGFTILSLLLFFGRPTLGPLLLLLPGSEDLPLHRYLAGVQLGAILLGGLAAGTAGTWVVGEARRRLPRVAPAAPAAAVVALGLALLAPAWAQVGAYDLLDTTFIANQQQADAADGADLSALLAVVKAKGDGRAYAGDKTNWGHQYVVGYVPTYLEMEYADMEGVGMWLNTQSLSSDVEVRFHEASPGLYDLFNIRYLVLPSDRSAPVPAIKLLQHGRHTLWQTRTSGWLELVDTVAPPIAADRSNVGRASAAFIGSAQLTTAKFPTVAFAGQDAAPPSLTTPVSADTLLPGDIQTQDTPDPGGPYHGVVVARRASVVLLKTTFDPGWRATVDGREVATQMLAPSFVGVPVRAGRHDVVFTYVPAGGYPLLFLTGAIGLVAVGLGPRWGVRPMGFARGGRRDPRQRFGPVLPPGGENPTLPSHAGHPPDPTGALLPEVQDAANSLEMPPTGPPEEDPAGLD